MNLVSNEKIKKLLFDRWKELDLSVAEVIQDAAERKVKICPTRLSRYKNGKKLGISEDQLLFLCTLYGIFITFNIGKPKLVVCNKGENTKVFHIDPNGGVIVIPSEN